MLYSGERCLKYEKDGVKSCRVSVQRGGSAHYDGVPLEKILEDETMKLVHDKSGELIIMKNPHKGNEGIGPEAPSKEEFILTEDFKGMQNRIRAVHHF